MPNSIKEKRKGKEEQEENKLSLKRAKQCAGRMQNAITRKG